MFKKIVNGLMLVAFIVSVSGCASVPTAFPMKPGMVEDFQVNQSITIQNTGDSEILKKWTASTIDFLVQELEARGATIVSNAPIVLKVGITDTHENAFFSYWAYRCSIFLKVETGKGYVKEFKIDDVSGSSLQRACNFCVTKSVAAILNDKKIFEYISNE